MTITWTETHTAEIDDKRLLELAEDAIYYSVSSDDATTEELQYEYTHDEAETGKNYIKSFANDLFADLRDDTLRADGSYKNVKGWSVIVSAITQFAFDLLKKESEVVK